MSIWFLIWFLLAVIILGATTWSTIILIKQKQAWKSFAEKNGLSFNANKFFESPTMEGKIGEYSFSFFTAVQQNEDSRKDRQIIVAQINTSFPFFDGVAAGTEKMRPFIESLEVTKPYKVEKGNWDKAHLIRVQNESAMSKFLTEERVNILNELLKFPKADVVILLDRNEGVFRFETSNPLQYEDKIDSFAKKIMARIEKLKPTTEEIEELSKLIQK